MSRGFEREVMYVVDVPSDGKTVQVRDKFGGEHTALANLRPKGTLPPEPGEQWVVERYPSALVLTLLVDHPTTPASTAHTHPASDLTGVVDISVLPVATSGEVSATEVVRADDARLSDARPPTTHQHAAADVNTGTFALARLPVAASGTSSATQVVRADDSRLSNARTPTTHSHTAEVDGGDVAASGVFTGSVHFKRIGTVVFCQGSLQRPTGFNTAFADTGVTIPAGFRPVVNQTLPPSPFWDSASIYQFRATNAGALEVRTNGASTTNMSISAVWFTD